MQKLLIGERVHLQVSNLFPASGNSGTTGGPGGGEVRLGAGQALEKQAWSLGDILTLGVRMGFGERVEGNQE